MNHAVAPESLPKGVIKCRPEDFVVDEIPAYAPSGEGPHLYVHLKKTNLTTDEAVRALAEGLGLDRREIGVAGLKDKVGVTTQWLSLLAEGPAGADLEARVAAFSKSGLEVLEQKRHINKLKTGHLSANRFTITVRGIAPERLPDIEKPLGLLRERGVPNAFGVQRFGREGDTHERARAWMTGKERPPGDPRLRRFHFSALQSWVFNAVLAHRVSDGTWDTPIAGDLLKKEETGGMFVCADVQLDRERAARGELCPTGPIVGDRMRQPEAEAFELEQRIIGPLIEGIDLRRARALGEGTRRPLRLRVAELSWRIIDSSSDEATLSVPRREGAAIEVRFVLAKGAYATTVLANVLDVEDASRPGQSGQSQAEEQ